MRAGESARGESLGFLKRNSNQETEMRFLSIALVMCSCAVTATAEDNSLFTLEEGAPKTDRGEPIPQEFWLTDKEAELMEIMYKQRDCLFTSRMLTRGYCGHYPNRAPWKGQYVSLYTNHEEEYTNDWTLIQAPKRLKNEWKPVFWSLARKRWEHYLIDRKKTEKEWAEERKESSNFFEDFPVKGHPPNRDKDILKWLKDKPPMIRAIVVGG